MGHIRLLTLPSSKKWREVIERLGDGADLNEVAAAAILASERDLKRASSDPVFTHVAQLLVELPLLARTPGGMDALRDRGIDADGLASVPALLAAIGGEISDHAFRTGQSSDFGDIARAALLESIGEELNGRLPTLFEPQSGEVRQALGSLASGDAFAGLARLFFARLTYGSLDYWLSRELANHTGANKRFASDADRVAFERALYAHTYEASKIVESFAGGWYGKTVWQERGELTGEAIAKFASYAFKKLRDELGRRYVDA